MPRFKLILEYDGSRYTGWQMQKNDRSIQGEILGAAYKVFDTRHIEVYGAGRTDAGVHARGQVAHLDVADTDLTPEEVNTRLNDELPFDINILSVEKADPRFHARQDALSRSYVYQISKRRDAFGKKYIWWVRAPLNVDAMREAAEELIGLHDFASFGDLEREGQSTMVEVDVIEIYEDDNCIYVCIRSAHFLWKMVRRIVGVLVEVGRGRMTTNTVVDFLKTPSREPARHTAPPSGLFLEGVTY